ncbi:YafY family protein [uncultured Acetobacteroides sp.]|uniref:helix-turn-helix transcriptional regulator n=1 Tax=uncultured Acetobacteroides sp. TaxID=1760811 RepID=UPI0029F4F927|nr:YafY family protein [uncultured Acetobacteroides sp.]
MNRIDRLQAILIHLQSKKVVTAAELADRFELSIRTVYRDIRALEEAGVPIGSEAGVGYFLSDSYHLPPVRFTNSEASALLIGAKFVEQMSDSQTREAYQSALFKIKSVLNAKEKDALEKLQDNILVFGQQNHNDNREKALLADVQQAIVGQTVLDIEYHAGYTNQRTVRRVEPIGMIYYGSSWHLIGFCQLRKDYRDLRIDRILSLERQDIPFSRKCHISLDEYFERMQNRDGMQKITLLVARDCQHHIKESKYWYGFTYDEEYDDQWLRLHFRNSDLWGFSRWVILGGSNVRIEEPQELKVLIRDLVSELAQAYQCE